MTSKADEDFDPEDLEPVAKIRYAVDLIRHEHRVLSDDWLFWNSLAGYLGYAACIPEKTQQHPGQHREFNRAQDIANGYLQMSKRLHHLQREE